jgi:hypothetical protein
MPARDIFLSYSSKDEAIVGPILEKLEAAGHGLARAEEADAKQALAWSRARV